MYLVLIELVTVLLENHYIKCTIVVPCQENYSFFCYDYHHKFLISGIYLVFLETKYHYSFQLK